MSEKGNFQNYDRQPDLRAQSYLFPKLDPALTIEEINDAIKEAIDRTRKNKKGEERETHDTPEKLVKACLKHLRERNDPIIGPSFYSGLKALEVFEMDEVPHEMQRYRMLIGVFYQYLLISLTYRAAAKKSHFMKVFDGVRQGDVVADVTTPKSDKGLRLYISVKKSIDTVGGQDMGDAIKRLEKIAKDDKNINMPYLCVVAIATPERGKITSYDKSRQMRKDTNGRHYSLNSELWLPGFLYPYVTGRSAVEIYQLASASVAKHFPFYSLKFRKECSELLHKELINLGIATKEGVITKDKFFQYVAKEEN
jgi:hypothetical protein